jgi:hypothetical protein
MSPRPSGRKWASSDFCQISVMTPVSRATNVNHREKNSQGGAWESTVASVKANRSRRNRMSRKFLVWISLAFSVIGTAWPPLLEAGAFQATDTFEEIVVCPTDDGFSEEIYISGSYRLLIQSAGGNGHATNLFYVFWHGDGVGLGSGSEYLLRGRWMEVIQDSPPYIFIWNDHFQLIGKGKAENFDTHFKIRLIVNAQGDTVVDYIDFWECENIE